MFRKKYLRCVIGILVVSLFTATSALSAESGRSKNRFGVYGSFISADPLPAPVGFNLGWNIFQFLRLNAGVGAYDAIVWNPFIGIYNYTFAPIFWFMLEVMTLGLLETSVRDFQASYFHAGEKQLFAYGGGGTLLVPGWNFSPAIGVGMSQVHTNVTYNGLKPGNHQLLYGIAGFDWTSQEGFHLGFGVHYQKKLESKIMPYINIGAFF